MGIDGKRGFREKFMIVTKSKFMPKPKPEHKLKPEPEPEPESEHKCKTKHKPTLEHKRKFLHKLLLRFQLSLGTIYVILALLIVSLFLMFEIQIHTTIKQQNPTNELRLATNSICLNTEAIWPIEDNETKLVLSWLQEKNINGSLVSRSGGVILSSLKKYRQGDKINLREILYMDQSYIVHNPGYVKLCIPVYAKGSVEGFFVFEKFADTKNTGSIQQKSALQEYEPFAWIAVLLSLLLLAAAFFKRDHAHFKELTLGLERIGNGVLKPLDMPAKIGVSEQEQQDLERVFIQYNILVEELSYIMEKQSMQEGKKKAFLTMISHELKTPIATMNAYVQGLVSGVAKDDATKEKYLKIIDKKMQKLMVQIEELFKYAQDESNQFKYNKQECYADECFKAVFEELANQTLHPVEITNYIPKTLILADRIRLEQVILNLFNNAVKHSNRTQPIKIRAYRQDNEIVIEIEDKGDGINSGDLPYIFDYYYQGSQSKKTDYEGVGLGLAICKEIVEQHEGRIKVKSRVDEGTTMTIVLPVL
jgi:signal transduction histidine kinase